MSVRFRVEVDGVEQFDRAFNRLDRLDDFRPVWPRVIQEFYSIEREQFATEGAAGESGKWAPLSKAYAKYKQANYPDMPILQRDQELVESLTDPEAFGAILRPSQDELVIGTSVPYALAHQRGSRTGLPKRPPISLSERQKLRLQKAIQEGLVRFIRDSGFNVEERQAA